MNLSNIVRSLAFGSMFTLAVVGIPAVHAHAEPNDSGIVMDCLNKSTGEWTLSGQVDYVTTSDGKTHAVGCDNGKWVDLGVVGASRSIAPTAVQPLMPRPIAGALGS